MLNLAMFGCAHLGYAPKDLRRRLPDGTNVVAADGYVAHRAILTDICDTASGLTGQTVIVDAGDLFHTPAPAPAAIDAALDCDRIRVTAGIERFSIPGNHDRSSAAGTPATAVLRDAPGCHVVAPNRFGVTTSGDADPRRRIIVDGLYEIWQLTDAADNGPQVYLHLVGEQALAPTADEMDAAVDPRPIDSGVNILVTHGIVPDDAMTYVQADERGGNRVIPRDWFDRGFTAALLSDFHTPASGTLGATPWAYTGSAVRRGFADAETPRGWMMCTVDDDGRISLGFHEVAQRPAVDETVTPPADPAAAVATVTEFLESLTPRATDAASGERTGDAGVRVRVTVAAPNPDVYDAATTMVPEWSRALPDALSLTVRVTGEGIPDSLSAALGTVDAVDDESVTEALHRLVAAGAVPALAGLTDQEIDAAVAEAATALDQL